jgi:3-hydroxy-9,10-secoandrosta-1,3,5(10)-triene-9,17-dione monooxygenase
MGRAEVLDRPAEPIISQPEPGLTPEMAISRAEALIPQLRAEQDEADRQGFYSQSIHEQMLEGGLYRLVQPKMFGGYEFSWTDFIRVVNRISRGHPSSGWCYCLGTSHAHIVASHWPEEAQREFFGPDGDFRSPHRAAPAGTFTPVDGGYRVSGTWSYSSGIPYATHFCGGAMIPNAEGRLRPANFCVAREKVTVLPDWGGDSALGMQGSGSNSVKLEDVFVPHHHLVLGDILFGQDIDWSKGTAGTRLHGNPMYLGVAGGPFHLCFSAIMAGAARAALDEYEVLIRERKAYGGGGGKMAGDPDVQRHVGEVLTLIECAEAIMFGAMEHWDAYLDRWTRTGQGLSAEDTMRMWAMGRQSSFMSCQAVETMFHSSGVASANKGQRLQLYFRDVQMFRIHPSSQNWVPDARGQTHFGQMPSKFAART